MLTHPFADLLRPIRIFTTLAELAFYARNGSRAAPAFVLQLDRRLVANTNGAHHV